MSNTSSNKILEREKDFHNRRYESESENRKSTEKYYALKKEFDRKYLEIIRWHASGKKVLEIGCGPNINSPHWMDTASKCYAIDLSEVAISQAQSVLADKKGTVHLMTMNAEAMDFEDNSFDVVCGKGIIHHLNVESFWKELNRILKPDGIGVFIEPLGHNPIINAYRRWTPQMRSEDEHPLLITDIRSGSGYFETVDVEYQHITTMLSALVPGQIPKRISFSVLNVLDKVLTGILPFTKKYCWMTLICVKNPKLKSR